MEASDLIRAFLAGDRTAVFQLTRWIGVEIRSHVPWLVARQREDLIQECLLRLWTALGRGEYRGQSGLQRYVRTVCRNVIVDQLRRRPEREVTGAGCDPTEETGGASPEDGVAARDLAARVLARLPEVEGRLLVEAYVAEKPYADMAAERGISPVALKVRVFRAVQRARAAWVELRDERGGAAGRRGG